MAVASALALLALGSRAADDSCVTWYDTTTHGSAFRNVRDFGAKGDGVTDDTAAIQRALDHDRGDVGAKRPAIVYLPPGTYRVTDTLVCWFHTELVGSFRCPSVVELAPLSPGFATPAPPGQGFESSDGARRWLKPVVVFQAGFNTLTGSHAWWSDRSPPSSPWCTPPAPGANDSLPPLPCGDGFNMNFYDMARFLTLRVGAGNPGATGLMWNVAQQTSIRNVTVDLTASGAIGVDVSGGGDALAYHEHGGGGDQGGGGTIEDVIVTGGEVGMRAKGSQWTFRTLRFDGAGMVGLQLTHTWSFSILDLRVDGSPTAVAMTDNQATLFVDCAFSGVSGPAAMVADARSQVYLERVRLESADESARAPSARPPLLLQSAVPGGNLSSLPANTSFYIGRGWKAGAALPLAGTLPVSAWRARSPLMPRPTFGEVGADVVNALEHGCKGDWDTDDTACLQSAIDAAAGAGNGGSSSGGGVAATVFLPFGFYRVTDTLRLRSNSRLVGEGLARVVLSDHAPGFGDVGGPKPMVQTASDASGATEIAGVRLTSGAGNVGAVLLDWSTGPLSALWDVHITVGSGSEGAGGLGVGGQGEVHTLLHVHGAGAGVFSNVHGWGADHNVSDDRPLPDGHALYGVRATSTGPVTWVGCAFEHHTRSAFNLTGASNYTFYALQTEQTAQAVVLRDTDGVLVYGSVITWSGAEGRSLVFLEGRNERLEIYGLNTLMKRVASDSPPWVMLTDGRNASCDVPALPRAARGSGNWGGRCGGGDCAMVAVFGGTC